MSKQLRKKELKRNRRLKERRLQRHQSSVITENEIVIRDMPGQARMSDVLLEFIEPYRDQARTRDDLEHLLSIGLLGWNCAMVTLPEREKFIRTSEEMLPPGQHERLREMVNMLIQRKLACFASIRRFIYNFEVTRTPEGPFHVEVFSSLPISEPGFFPPQRTKLLSIQ